MLKSMRDSVVMWLSCGEKKQDEYAMTCVPCMNATHDDIRLSHVLFARRQSILFTFAVCVDLPRKSGDLASFFG